MKLCSDISDQSHAAPLPDSHLEFQITNEITGKIALKIEDLQDHYRLLALFLLFPPLPLLLWGGWRRVSFCPALLALSKGLYPLACGLSWPGTVVLAMVRSFFPVGRRGLGLSWGCVAPCLLLCCGWCLCVVYMAFFLALGLRCAGLVCCVCGVLGLLALGRRCVRSLCCVCGVHGPLTLVHRWPRFVYCVCGVPGLLALVHQCASLLCFVRRVLGLRALVHRCACLVCCVCDVLSLFAPFPAVCTLGVLYVRCPWPLGATSLVCAFDLLCVRCLRRLKLHGQSHTKCTQSGTMRKNSFSQAMVFENRILVQRKYLSYHLCHFVPFSGQPKTKEIYIKKESLLF